MPNKQRITAPTFRVLCILSLCLAFFLAATDSQAAENYPDSMHTNGNSTQKNANEPPSDVVQAVRTLLEMPGDRNASFDAAAAAPLLDYVASSADDDLSLPSFDGASGAMIRETVDSPLSRILEYAYNPDIPAYLIFPSVVRLSGWEPGSDILAHPGLWKELETLDKPIVLHGQEFEQITPDEFSGAYYRYLLDRTIILTKYQDKNVLLSISRQNGLSDIGKKGVILNDDTWNYFYSGIEGLTKGGIGWMDTYIYGSWSVSAYIQDPATPEKTTNVVFKWLRGGWAKMNVIRPKHILSGCQRFADAFNAIISSAKLPAASDLATKAREVKSLAKNELDKKIQQYALALEKAYAKHPDLDDGDFQDILEKGHYATTLSRIERISTLLLEYLKSHLGTPTLVRG